MPPASPAAPVSVLRIWAGRGFGTTRVCACECVHICVCVCPKQPPSRGALRSCSQGSESQGPRADGTVFSFSVWRWLSLKDVLWSPAPWSQLPCPRVPPSWPRRLGGRTVMPPDVGMRNAPRPGRLLQQDAGSCELGGTHVSGAGQGPGGQRPQSPAPCARASGLCPVGVGAVESHWTRWCRGSRAQPLPCCGDVPPAVTPSVHSQLSSGHLLGSLPLVCKTRQPPGPHPRLLGRRCDPTCVTSVIPEPSVSSPPPWSAEPSSYLSLLQVAASSWLLPAVATLSWVERCPPSKICPHPSPGTRACGQLWK